MSRGCTRIRGKATYKHVQGIVGGAGEANINKRLSLPTSGWSPEEGIDIGGSAVKKKCCVATSWSSLCTKWVERKIKTIMMDIDRAILCQTVDLGFDVPLCQAVHSFRSAKGRWPQFHMRTLRPRTAQPEAE